MRRDREGTADSVKVIERKEKADPRLFHSAMSHFDLAQIIVAQEEAASHRCRACDHVAFTLLDHAAELRVILEDKIHFPLCAAGKALASTTQCGAFGTRMMKNSVGERKEDIGWIQFHIHRPNKVPRMGSGCRRGL